MRLSMMAVCYLVVGCASANVDPTGDRPDGPRVDSPTGVDAPGPVDAAVTAVSLAETGSTAIAATQIGCQQNNPATSFTTPNSYYRIFPLSDFGVTGSLHVDQVTFGVERSTPGGGGASQPATIKIGTYSGTLNAASFPLGQLSAPVATASVQIPLNATSVTTQAAAFSPSTIVFPAGSNVYIEIAIPDGRPAGNIFYIGSNAGTETHPSYIFATDCSINSPTSYDSVTAGTPPIRLLITADGHF